MKVKDLLKWTVWKPGTGYKSLQAPTLSILLPTFRRGSDGLFLRVARSILAQSLTEIELIIIDDASTDGTADLIADLMAEDGRVSCLTHKINIGLPAISEYEAFLKARGEFIGFGFDDFLFELKSLERMIGQMKTGRLDAAYGNVSLQLDADTEIPLGEVPGLDRLAQDNFIGNSSVILRREVIEEVGFYDPHVALTRVCDWDLWRRVVRKKALTKLDITVGRELGASRPDSLGNTYPMHPEAIQEFFAEERDELLTPQNFAERDIFELPEFASVPLQQHIQASTEFFLNKAWFNKPVHSEAPLQRKVVSIFNDLGMAAQSAWGAIPNSSQFHINWVGNHPGTFYQDSLLLRSDAVVFHGDLSNPYTLAALDFCKKHRVPSVYYVDERSPLVRRLPHVKNDRERGVLGKTFSLKRRKRSSNLEELRYDLLVKGWAYESDKAHSWLEVLVDGVLVGYVEAALERPDLREAGFGEGTHGFSYLLPRSVFDGKSHEIGVRWADSKTHLQNSPMHFLLPHAAEVEAKRNSLDAEHPRSQILDVFDLNEAFAPFHAIVAGGEQIRDTLLQRSPNRHILVSRPCFNETKLRRQREIRSTATNEGGELRVAVLPADVAFAFDQSSLQAGLQAVRSKFSLRFDLPVDGVAAQHSVVERTGIESDFGGSIDEWTMWSPDAALLPASVSSIGDRADHLILQCLYIGAAPVVPDLPIFAGWSEASGVRRVADTPQAWASAVNELSENSERRDRIARLEAACKDRFSVELQQKMVQEMLNDIQPVSHLTLSERYRSAWRERATR